VAHEDDVRVADGVDGRERAAGPRCADVPHAPREVGGAMVAALLEALDRRAALGLGEVRPLGEEHERPAAVDLLGERGDLVLDVAAARVDEPVGQHRAEDVDERLDPQRVVHDDVRPPAVAHDELVDDEQRVALPRVPAEQDHRAVRRAQRGVRPGALVGDDLHVGEPDDHPVEPATKRCITS
jgi:hypothetical protein